MTNSVDLLVTMSGCTLEVGAMHRLVAYTEAVGYGNDGYMTSLGPKP